MTNIVNYKGALNNYVSDFEFLMINIKLYTMYPQLFGQCRSLFITAEKTHEVPGGSFDLEKYDKILHYVADTLSSLFPLKLL